METGQITGDGFLPQHPSLDDMLKRIGIGGEKGGWSALANAPIGDDDTRKGANDDLKRCYAQIAATPGGLKVLEDLLNQSIRRSCSHPDPRASIEQEALYGRERKGQNGLMCYILRMIHDGQKLPNTASAKKSKKQ